MHLKERDLPFFQKGTNIQGFETEYLQITSQDQPPFILKAQELYGGISESFVRNRSHVYEKLKQLKQSFLYDDAQKDNQDILVDHFLIDFQNYEFQNKIAEHLGDRQFQDKQAWTNLQLAQLLRSVNEKYPDSIGDQFVVRKLIENQYET